MLFHDAAAHVRHFTSYSGTVLPLRLVGPLDSLEMDHRNTFISAYFDETGHLLGFEKWVYGEVHLIHRYGYHDGGTLSWAEIAIPGDECTKVWFDVDGNRLRTELTPLED